MLPECVSLKVMDLNFLTRWQAVIFRNYGIVPTEKIAETLGSDVETVETEARRLGLEKAEANAAWTSAGYITVIRNNWHLLPYSQIMQLLSMSEERLAFCLKEEDFLYVKVGKKPIVDEVKYSPLTEAEIKTTEEISQTIKSLAVSNEYEPFDFFSKKADERTFDFSGSRATKIVHGYLTPCGDALMEKSETYLPDELLEEYKRQGINGLWMHGVLSALSPYPFNPELSKNYKERRAELKRLIARCAAYGIKVYMYFNEPRYLREEAFGKYSHLMGHKERGIAALCLSQKEMQDYLYEAFKDFVGDIGNLGGIITITMSEYLTNCHSHGRCNCPLCSKSGVSVSISRVNNIIMRAIKDSGAKTELLANLWGWSRLYGMNKDEIFAAIDMLDKDISVICVSEYGLDLNKGGVKVGLIDYSISNPGPSEEAQANLTRAKENGHKIYAKIQANNSWECSCVPWLPVFDLVKRHLDNLSAIGVNDYMLCWTLGGYPSPNLNLVAAHEQGKTLDEWYKEYYGEDAEAVHEAVKCICDGFEQYPFSVDNLYFAPCTLGPANMWSFEAEEKESTMVCFSFDDYKKWTRPYPIDIFLDQYEKMLTLWKKGVELLKKMRKTPITEELIIMAEGAYLHFESCYNQTRYSIYKLDKKANKDKILSVIAAEKETTKRLLALTAKDARVGYEASNHYFYTQNILKEKVVNLNAIEKKVKEL